MARAYILVSSFLFAILSSNIFVDALECYHCGWSEIGQGGEHVDCVEGTNLDDNIVDCAEAGWGAECISRVLTTGEGEDIKNWSFRSCIGSDFTCEEGYEDFGDNQLWTSCCSEDNCNDGDPTVEFPAPSDLHCYSCGWVDGAAGGDCVLGINLEDTSTHCQEEGWGDGCITRVVLDIDGNEQWFRSCIALNMKCIDGYNDYGDYGQLWTTCCNEDNCNDHNPKEEITTEPPSGLSCLYCGWEDVVDGGDCVLGNNLENTSMDCMENGWGQGCISRTFKDADGNEQIFRSCIGMYMTCEEGYGDFGEYGELWTHCCNEDNCNYEDPKEVVGVHCYSCGWDFENEGGDCVSGENLADTTINCAAEGWGDGCISRVFKDSNGTSQYFRSCIGKYMTCETGYGDYGDYGELWTSCCDEDNCNDDDAKETVGIHCYSCGWDFENDGGDCVSGDNLADTSINCAAEGWGNGCISRVFQDSNGTTQYFRSCIGKYMTCVDGYGDYGDYGELWTSCCDEDNCNDDDPKEELPALHCYQCGWDFSSEGGSCVEGTELEDTSINCKDEGWGSGCITRVYADTDGVEQVFRSCIGEYMTCVEGYSNLGGSGELWTTCCETDNCNDDNPKDAFSTTPASTTSSSTTVSSTTTAPSTITSAPAVTTTPNTASGLQMSILLLTPMFMNLLANL